MNLELSKIIHLQSDQINSKLNFDNVKVGVIGIGRIGLPTGILFAKSGFSQHSDNPYLANVWSDWTNGLHVPKKPQTYWGCLGMV